MHAREPEVRTSMTSGAPRLGPGVGLGSWSCCPNRDGCALHIKQDRESFALEIPGDPEIKAIRFGRGRWCVPAGGSTGSVGNLAEAVT